MGKITVKQLEVRELNFMERAYLPEILRGLWITNRHFMVNLYHHLLGALGIRTGRKGAVTIQYPEQHRRWHIRSRTRHYLPRRADGSPRCVGCMMCETVCPARCIYIVAKEYPDREVEKQAFSYTIDMGKCIYCAFCVEVCPEDAIRMDSGDLEISQYSRGEMIWDTDRLMLSPHKPQNYKNYGEYFKEELK